MRVHNLVPKQVWQKRYTEINAFEQRLSDNGTHVLKLFLYISKEEQLKRFEQRLNDPKRQWKISEDDYKDREHWSEYQHAYEAAFSKCSTKYAPWFVIPSDHKWYRNLLVTQIIVKELEDMNIETPKPTIDLRAPAQILLRWCLQRDTIVLPKSTHQERIEENAQIFDFALSDDDLSTLDGLDRTGGTDAARERKWW